jgi:Predicted nucleotide-binding protein containing TIR-like domain
MRLTCDEFNAEAVAGRTTTARLEEMLDTAWFAFLVMTAEDTYADNTAHARENVIHEAGLFQGRLGFERAIILLEEGCAQFSNIHGLTHIGFPKGNLEPAFENIRRVLEGNNNASNIYRPLKCWPPNTRYGQHYSGGVTHSRAKKQILRGAAKRQSVHQPKFGIDHRGM